MSDQPTSRELDVEFLEVLIDIAYLAGARRFHSGNSRDDVQTFIGWAREFERVYADTPWGTGDYDYMETVESFAESKMFDYRK